MLASRLWKWPNVNVYAGKSMGLQKERIDQALETKPAEPDRQFSGATRVPGFPGPVWPDGHGTGQVVGVGLRLAVGVGADVDTDARARSKARSPGLTPEHDQTAWS